jgi:glycosyltransferase involved in cell wall biosynthesis
MEACTVADPENPLISVVLACYNQEEFVREAVEGVLSQTYSPLEIVIVDDCSPDRTADVIEATLAEHPKRTDVRLVRNKTNLTPAGVSQLGLSITLGEFIIIASGDDILLPEMIVEVAKAWRQGNASLVITNAAYIDENSNSLNRTFRDPNETADDSFETLARDGVNACCFGPCMSFERELYRKFGWPPTYLEAADIMFPFYANLLKGARFINKPLFRYRVHSDNTSLSLIANRESDEIEKAAVLERIFYIHLAHALFMKEELSRVSTEEPARYSEIEARISPLLSIQAHEMAKKFVKARRELGELRAKARATDLAGTISQRPSSGEVTAAVDSPSAVRPGP